MNIGIDLTALMPHHTGIDRFLVNTVRHLALIQPEALDCRFTVFANREDLALLRGVLPRSFAVHGLCLRPRIFRLFFQQVILPLAAIVLRLDVVHSPSFIIPVFRARARHVLTVHDLTTITLPDVHIPLRRSKAFGLALGRSIRKADLVCVPSRFVKDDIVRRIPGSHSDRIRVIPHGIEEQFTPAAIDRAPDVAKRLGLNAPYILYLGNIDPRKNVDVLIRSYQELVVRGKIEEHLVLAGPLGWGVDEVLRLAKADAIVDRVHFPGYIPDADMPALMAGARLFVFPSQAEGFGFPPLEAMACGVPVIATDTSALAENLTGAAEMVPPNDQDALTDRIRRVLGDRRLAEEMAANGIECASRFRWDANARSLLDCYRELRENDQIDAGAAREEPSLVPTGGFARGRDSQEKAKDSL